MNNYREVPYPEPDTGLKDLLTDSQYISRTMLDRLEDAPLLSTIFTRPPKSQGEKREPNIQRDKQWNFQQREWESTLETAHTDFEGLYAFAEEVNGQWIFRYVGISRNVMKRLKQHGWGKESNTATLAHLIAKQKHLSEREREIYGRRREEEAEKKREIKHKLETRRRWVRDNFVKQCKVVVYRLKDDKDYELYFHEVAIAAIFKCYWNSFRTH